MHIPQSEDHFLHDIHAIQDYLLTGDLLDDQDDYPPGLNVSIFAGRESVGEVPTPE